MSRSLLAACAIAAYPVFLGAVPRTMTFQEWLGPGEIQYRTTLDGGAVRLTARGIVYLLDDGQIMMTAPSTKPWQWSVDEALDARVHVFSNTGVRHSSLAVRLIARNVYPGIDVTAHGNGSEFEYDFVVHPNADPRTIGLRFGGAGVRLERGELCVEHSRGILRHHAPVAYQKIGGLRRPVEVSYRLDGALVRFDVKRYDRRYPLIIDPVVAWATGGPQRSSLSRVALGRDGSIYAIGTDVAAPESTSRFGASQGIGAYSLVKLKAGGAEIAYIAYVSAPTADFVYALSVDPEGCAYVAGWTNSATYPVTNGAFQTSPGDLRSTGAGDGFVTKFSADGSSLVYSTLLGGSGDDAITGLAVDEQGNAYLAGHTSSPNFPTTTGAWRSEFEQVYRLSDHSYWGGRDGFLLQLNNTGAAIVRSTVGLHVTFPVLARESTGDLYVAGIPFFGFDREVSDGASAALGVMKFTGDLSRRIWANGFGRASATQPRALAIDSEGQLLVAGQTTDSSFPTTPGAFQKTLNPPASLSFRGVDAFLMKVLRDGSGLAFSTFFGGTGDDWIFGVAADPNGSIHVAGATTSSNFPVTADALQPRFGGGVLLDNMTGDGFYARFSGDGSKLETSTYLGGSSFLDRLDAVALDPAGAVYLSGTAGGAAASALSGPPQWQSGSAALIRLAAEAGAEPRLAELIPNRLNAGIAGAAIQVVGENFRPDAALLVDETRIPASAASATLLEVQLPAGLLERVRDLNVRVVNPGIGASNAVTLTIARGDNLGKPYLRSVAPTSAAAGSLGMQLRLTGSGLESASMVSWKGELRAPDSVAGGEALFTLTAADLREPGSFPIAVSGPNGDSNTLTFTVSSESPAPPGPTLPIYPLGEAAQGAPEQKATFTILSPSISVTVDGEKRPLQPGFLDREWDVMMTAPDHGAVGMRELQLVDQATGKVSNGQPYFVYLPLESRFLAFNSARRVLYAVIVSRNSPEDFVVLDGQNFTRLAAVQMLAAGRPLVSGDGRFLYVPYEDARGVRWKRLETLSEAPWLRLPEDSLDASTLGVVPGLPDTILLARSQGGDLLLQVLDGNVPRPQSLTLRGRGAQRPEVLVENTTSAWLLFGNNGEYGRDAIRLTLDAQGVVSSESPVTGVSAGLSQVSAGGFWFTTSGQVLETARLTPIARFPAATRGPIGAGGRIAFVSASSSSLPCLFTVIDPNSLRPEWSILGGGGCFNDGDLVALDGDRFAWTAFAKGVYVIRKPSAYSSPEPEITTQPGAAAVQRIDLVREAGVFDSVFYYLWTGSQPVDFLPYLVQKGGPVDREFPVLLAPASAPGGFSVGIRAPSVPGLWAGDVHFTIPNSVAPIKTIPITLETVPVFPLRADPAAVEFQFKPNVPPSPARVHILKDGSPFSLNYGITYATQARDWLLIRNIDRYQTPLDLEFVPNAGNLAAGEYKASVELRITGGATLVIPVTLRIER